MTPVEAAPQDGPHDQVICVFSSADADSDIDFPQARHVEIREEKPLMLLIVHGGNSANRSIVCVPFETHAHRPRLPAIRSQ